MHRKRKARELWGNVVELGYTTHRQYMQRRRLYIANVNAVTTDQSSIVAHVENNRSPIRTNSFCFVSHLEQPWQPITRDKRERSIILVSSEQASTSYGHSTGTSKNQNISLQRMQKDVNENEAGSSCLPNEIVEYVEANHFEPQGVSPLYIDLGDCDQICEHCKATFWYVERLSMRSKDQQFRYHCCCRGGRVVLPVEPEPPAYIKDLFKDKHFLDNIRAYNQMFSMTSFGARVDESINTAGTGPYVFKISGQIFHWIGTLCPAEGDPPRFLQLYIYDTENEVSNRMCHFGGQDNSGNLRPEIVEGLISFLNEHNGLVRLFRMARDKCNENCVPEFRIRLYNDREDEPPTSQTLGAIVFESGPKTQTDYDVIIEMKDGKPKRINKLHPSYMSLQYPLLFIYGQSGFHGSMKLINFHDSESEKIRNLTMNMYYAHQLHDRFIGSTFMDCWHGEAGYSNNMWLVLIAA